MSDQQQQQTSSDVKQTQQQTSETESKTFYRKATSIYSAFLESVGDYAKAPFVPDFEWYITEKIDGSQLWIEIKLLADGSHVISFRSHGGGECFQGALTMTLEKLTTTTNVSGKPHSYQGANLTKILPPVLTGFIELMKFQNLSHSHFYCELTLPGKTPCQLPYPDDMKSRVWLFNQVYFDASGQKISVSLTSENIKLYERFNIPTVPLVLHGEKFSLDDFQKVLDWCDTNPDHEGVMFYQPGSHGRLLKVKTHHAESLIKEKPQNMTDFDSQAYDMYMASLSKSKVITRKRERFAKEQERKLNAPLSADEIMTEISKEFTHDSHQDFLEKYYAEPVNQRHAILKTSVWYSHVCNSLTETYKNPEKISKSEKFIIKLMVKYLNDLTQ
jgi:hypothetical protein